ncbi:hypothetical protein HRI_004905100 [Hibiscus trionum]|uniref:CCHC-type domain-containing protein n=1 Tax=Hibiscus trionum TaxID=183268 RepID=A0A9W7JIS8_HIBTR|nr:hypothetical protein HRI_004905100 [Hibiscus trionum]
MGQQMEVKDTPPVSDGSAGAGGGPSAGPTETGGHKDDVKEKLSFCDMVVGQRSEGQKDNFICDLDVDLEANDVVIGNVGEVPEIKFSKRVHRIIDDKLAKSLVVRLLGRSIVYRALHNRVHMMWKPMGEISIIDLDNEYFLVRFAMDADYEHVLSGGPWMIYGSYLTLQPWSREFSTAIDYPRKLLVWLRLPGLPYRYYSRSIFEAIVGVLGEVIRVDFNTTEGSRGKFARLVVVVDLEKPLIPAIIIDGRHQLIKYEGLSHICFACGKYGHLKEVCANTTTSKGKAKVVESVIPEKIDRFGPWIQAPSRRRWPPLMKEKPPLQAAPKQHPGSRFSPLIVESEGGTGTVDEVGVIEETNVGSNGRDCWEKQVVEGGISGVIKNADICLDSRVTTEARTDPAEVVGNVSQHADAAGCSAAVDMRGVVVSGKLDVPVALSDLIIVENSSLPSSNHTTVRVVDDGGVTTFAGIEWST